MEDQAAACKSFLEVAFNAIRDRMDVDSDINEHLALLFDEVLIARPLVLVELGVRKGESTFALYQGVIATGGHMLSVDRDDCSKVVPATCHTWHFMQEFSVQAADRFQGFCKFKIGGVVTGKCVGFLFIDTCHQLEMTRREIAGWFRHLAPNATVAFHDTNQRHGGVGVPKALGQYLGVPFMDWRRKTWVKYINGWLVKHYPNCDGLTIMRRVVEKEPPPEWQEWEDKWWESHAPEEKC